MLRPLNLLRRSGVAVAGFEFLDVVELTSRKSDRLANQRQLASAQFTQVANAGHFITLERPDVLADLLNSLA